MVVIAGGSLLAGSRRGTVDRLSPGPGQQSGSGDSAAVTEPEPINVIASIFPLADIVSKIAGRSVAVDILLPPGASPHTYELPPDRARLLAGADLVVLVGGGLDLFAETLTGAVSPGALRLELLPAVPSELLIPGTEGARPGGGGVDPHVWLDPLVVREYLLPAIVSALTTLQPDMAVDFVESAEAFRTQLTQLDGWIRERLIGLEDKGLITIHPAWAYFGARYGLETWAVEGQPGQEPSPRRVMDLLEIAVERGITTLFVEPQLSKQAAEALVLELGGQVLTLDPLGGTAAEGYSSYLEMMRTNVLTIERGLR
jgi:zinc transport system substrate-binding protein